MSRFIADTSVWSLFLRRSSSLSSKHQNFLKEGILNGEVQMLGIIRQECLSGIKEPAQWGKLKGILQGFPDLPASSEDHIVASDYFNTCRRNGVQGGAADFLICAQAARSKLPILTLDKDFKHYSEVLPVTLLSI